MPWVQVPPVVLSVPVGLAVVISPSHGGGPGSTPGRGMAPAQLSIGDSPQEFEPPWLLFVWWSYDRVVKVIDSKAGLLCVCVALAHSGERQTEDLEAW